MAQRNVQKLQNISIDVLIFEFLPLGILIFLRNWKTNKFMRSNKHSFFRF